MFISVMRVQGMLQLASGEQIFPKCSFSKCRYF